MLLTLHGWGFWALWLWEGEYIRGFYWDAHGTNMLAGAVSWLSGAALWVTATSYVRRNYFEARHISTAFVFLWVQFLSALARVRCACVVSSSHADGLGS